ncbi:MAG: hypothetical protein HY996_04575 [Micrococcales bacterium]|nr:hypothetical protein [Micrococcales bacterium]
MSHDDHPELSGYVPTEGMPHRRRRLKVMRVVVLVGIAGLVLPTVLGTWLTAARSASTTCGQLVDAAAPDADPSSRFDAFGPGGPQWYCYAVGFGGDERIIAGLGLIPAGGGIASHTDASAA